MASRSRIAWVLNLDADVELGAIVAAGETDADAAASYTPKRSVVEAMRSFIPVIAASLTSGDDMIVDDATPPLAARDLRGRSFSPTPRALRVLRRAGAEPDPHPSTAVLCRVCSRAFAASLGPTLPQATFITDLEAARAKLETTPELGDGWRVKRAFGMTGRRQRFVVPASVSEPDLAFVNAGMREGGVQIEPNLLVVDEYAIHGMLDEAGALRIGVVVKQRCDERGAWIATERLRSQTPFAAVLEEEANRVGAALFRAGYFGPFGIDAYTYRDRDGAVHFQPRSEINARYTMGFAIGFGAE